MLHGFSSILPSLSLYRCSDFLPGFTLLSHGSQQLYSPGSKSNTYTAGHPTSQHDATNTPSWLLALPHDLEVHNLLFFSLFVSISTPVKLSGSLKLQSDQTQSASLFQSVFPYSRSENKCRQYCSLRGKLKKPFLFHFL